MPKIIVHSDIKEGRMQPNAVKLIQAGLKTFEGKRVVIIIDKEKKSRSVQQNRYYFGVVLDILSKELGYTPEEVHDILKFKFLKTPILIGNDEEMLIKSTTELTTTEFMDYIASIQQWAAELNINIPDPGEQIDLTF